MDFPETATILCNQSNRGGNFKILTYATPCDGNSPECEDGIDEKNCNQENTVFFTICIFALAGTYIVTFLIYFLSLKKYPTTVSDELDILTDEDITYRKGLKGNSLANIKVYHFEIFTALFIKEFIFTPLE